MAQNTRKCVFQHSVFKTSPGEHAPLKQWAKHYRMGPLDPQPVTFKKALAT